MICEGCILLLVFFFISLKIHHICMFFLGGTHLLGKWECAAQMGYFFTQNPQTWIPFWSKNPYKKRSHFRKTAKKACKISHVWGIKPLEMSTDLQKFQQSFREKILRYGKGFQTLGHTSSQKIIRVVPPWVFSLDSCCFTDDFRMLRHDPRSYSYFRFLLNWKLQYEI